MTKVVFEKVTRLRGERLEKDEFPGVCVRPGSVSRQSFASKSQTAMKTL